MLAFLLLCALPVYGSASLGFRQVTLIPALALIVMSLLAFVLYRHDKRQAGNGGQRTPENVLHATELLGGWPGALLAQQVFRHKTRKVPFQVVFWLIVLAHQALWLDWLFLGKRLLQLSPL
ncbi:Integral membrane protein [Pseudomonas syringae pv. persicae]|uniref:Integral membrane protein n=1 Tax=Pseudomonas syringae pv. persicae TaxID=237306 RepID=A0A3M4AXP8_9PSED|nr:Integral membrane protein [Pseudomonas syringae pv. persicae]